MTLHIHELIKKGYHGVRVESLEQDMEKARDLGNTNLAGEFREKVRHELEMLLPSMRFDLREYGYNEKLSDYIARAEVLEQEVQASI